jgi:Putative adhesin
MTDIRNFAVAAVVLPLFLCAAPAFPREIGSFDRALTVTGSVDLEVETNSGHITVRRGSSNAVRVRGIISVSDNADASGAEQRAREIEANPPIHQNGSSIRIEKLLDIADRHISISYEIEAPQATRLRARTGSGGQMVQGVQGPVNASTGSGSIRISDIGDEVRADTGSGGIELESIKGRVDATTGSGSIRANNLTAQVTAHTGSGGVQIQLPTNGGFDLRARTGSGRVSVDPPITMENFSADRHDVRGKIRGGGPLIDVATGSGGVHVD